MTGAAPVNAAERRLTAAAVILVLLSYVFMGFVALSDRENPDPRDAPYNLLARGFLAGHLYIDKAAPPGLVALRDPYDPDANRPFTVNSVHHLHDLSYYKGRLYLYFGAAPAVFVFIPWHLLTGGWLAEWVAVAALCMAGFLVNVSLLRSLRRSDFEAARAGVMPAAVLIVGFASYAPILLSRPDMWEVPIAFEYLGVSLALRFLWEAFRGAGRAATWIALASLAVGLAFAARPTVLPSAVVLALPFLLAPVRRSVSAWCGAVLPAGVCGCAVALYNAERFGNPFDFGQKYQLAGQYVARLKLFSAGFLPSNLRLYLFQPVHWTPIFPFVDEPPDGMLPAGHGTVEHMSGVLLNAPVLWMALAAALVFAARRPAARLALAALAAACVFAGSLLLVSLFFGACARYEFEFAPSLSLLAALGVLAAESSPDPRWRLARVLWIPALAFSVAFPMLYGIDRCVLDHEYNGIGYAGNGDAPHAEREFAIARALSPGNRFSRLALGAVLSARGRSSEALGIFEGLVRDEPGYAMAQFDLAHELAVEGRLDEAVAHYQIAHSLEPDDPRMLSALNAAVAERDGAKQVRPGGPHVP